MKKFFNIYAKDYKYNIRDIQHNINNELFDLDLGRYGDTLKS
jgi:hypothetical protein